MIFLTYRRGVQETFVARSRFLYMPLRYTFEAKMYKIKLFVLFVFFIKKGLFL